MGEELTKMEEWQQRVNQDISELKQGQSHLTTQQSKQKDDIRDLQMSRMLQAQEIQTIKEDLAGIKSDTSWIRRRITGAIITATVTAIIGGIIALAISNVF